MPAPKNSTFVVERSGPQGIEKTEITAERGEQAQDSTRVTFFIGEEAVGSFINTQAWYIKPAS